MLGLTEAFYFCQQIVVWIGWLKSSTAVLHQHPGKKGSGWQEQWHSVSGIVEQQQCTSETKSHGRNPLSPKNENLILLNRFEDARLLLYLNDLIPSGENEKVKKRVMKWATKRGIDVHKVNLATGKKINEDSYPRSRASKRG